MFGLATRKMADSEHSELVDPLVDSVTKEDIDTAPGKDDADTEKDEIHITAESESTPPGGDNEPTDVGEGGDRVQGVVTFAAEVVATEDVAEMAVGDEAEREITASEAAVQGDLESDEAFKGDVAVEAALPGALTVEAAVQGEVAVDAAVQEEGAVEAAVPRDLDVEAPDTAASEVAVSGGVIDEAASTLEQDVEKGMTPSPVPKSVGFSEGERPESPVRVGEKLSRSPTPEAESPPSTPLPSLRPVTPGSDESRNIPQEGDISAQPHVVDDKVTEEAEYAVADEEGEDLEPEFDRDLLIERYQKAIAEREQIQQLNYQVQHKLAEYFRKKKSDDTRQEMEKNVTDQEQRYLKYMATVEELRNKNTSLQDDYSDQIEDLKDRCQDRENSVDDLKNKFFNHKRSVATAAINTRSGKPIPQKDIEAYLVSENRKEAEVVNVRLENIKLKNKLKKKELHLKSKEELAEGLHLIDFEQLKIENQTYNEKIEERNEELLKLRKKITSTVQVLTHLKEKLQFVQAENQVQKVELREVEEVLGKKRDVLSRTKQARDSLRIDNQKLRQKCGLLDNEPLLRDFEKRKDDVDGLRDKLQALKTYHAELTLNCAGVRRKIELARMDSAT